MNYSIWMEGYAATGQSSPAQFLGAFKAENFRNACIIWDSIHNRDKGYGNFDIINLSVWGCSLFDNEADARRSFG